MDLPRFKSLKEKPVFLTLLLLSLTVASFYLFYLRKKVEGDIFTQDFLLSTNLFGNSQIFPLFLFDTLGILTTILLAALSIKILLELKEKSRTAKDLSQKLTNKDEILSVAAHELYTPMTNIKNTLYVILPEVKEDYRKFAERAIISTEELIKLLDDLLTISRFEMGKIKLNREPADLDRLCREVVGEFTAEAEKSGLELSYEYENAVVKVPEIPFDHEKIKEILVNLIGNALKYTSSGTIKVSLKSTKGMVTISVADSGEGIEPENLKMLFHRFVRVEPTNHTPSHHGVGLGLYISRLIVESHGGKIWAESETGQGSTFYFSLPVSGV